MTVELVRGGRSVTCRGVTAAQTAMFQIMRDYAGLPDVRALKLSEILFYYDGLRGELEQRTAPRS
ncbi:hypothetical protein [Oceanospirillum phage vB_OsaM_PD0307]|nr:hypothetical protein [Oceanospirillum phage vB_OsaM_PD0307]